ncbi:class I SAM-dependent methyltransferase [Nitratireductor kimnyeongensis]|uniref:Class I SAM-dependent methyltransferase n=1 Tax=Nitratireductor kimnyeongensis TaxID=430679 RepID=A0ABW0T6K5_9HYPH|nr:class I SAM-dependent methyltransferase [Nitratireductor kimnyeongensis]QZZ34733.1 class I SAM-dependent methyltransferase [Nitratireductor kimnyeongensis]
MGLDNIRDVRNGIDVCRKILSSSDEEFSSRRFILDCILDFGIIPNNWALMSRFGANRNTSLFGLIQYPTEFADFLMALSRVPIESAIEIGVFRGASSYFICSVLQRANKNVKYTMLDIEDNVIAFDEFSRFLNIIPAFKKTSDDFAGQKFDFAFIDGDHSYEGVNKDIINIGNFAKCVAFHDIYGHEYNNLNGGVVRAWREFVQAHCMDMSIMEFSHAPEQWMGLGLAIRTD